MGFAEVCSGRSKSIWIPLPSFRLHPGSCFFPTSQGTSHAASSFQSTPAHGGRVCVCAHAQVRRVGDENDICPLECQHMGVPVACDRCLTEEVREGPGFPGCLLCSLSIAWRNTLSEEQREKGREGQKGSGRGRWSRMPIPPGLGRCGPCRGAEDYPMKEPLYTHHFNPEEGSSSTSPPFPLCICRGVQSLAVGQALDLGSSHLSPSLHQLALEGRGQGCLCSQH